MRRFLLSILAASPLAAQAGDPAIPALGARVTRLRFFEGGRTPPTLRDRQYAVQFDSAAARSIYVEIGLSYPPLPQAVNLKVECGYTAAGGAPAGTAVVPIQADAGWELSVHAGGTGGDAAGGWKAGSYAVACRFGGKVIATGSFAVTRPAPVVAAPPPPPPAPPKTRSKNPPKNPSRSGNKPAPAFGGLKARVTGVKMFESGGDIPEQKSRVTSTSFDALTTRFINFEFELEYPRAGRKTDFEVPCRIDGPDSVARAPTIKGSVDAGWVGSYHVIGWGSRDRGMWPEGDYRLTCRDQGQVVATAEFKVVKARAAVESLGASLTHIRFFQSLAERLPLEGRLYGTRFDSRTARWIKTEFGLVYGSVAAPVSFAVECIYTFPDGTAHPVAVTRRVPAAWTGSVHVQGIGWDQPGNWPPGVYQVSCRSDGREFAAGGFELMDGAAAPPNTAGATLRFFARNDGDPPAPVYAATFAAGTFDTLYAEAAVPSRAAGDSTGYRCTLTDPAGVTSAFSLAGQAKDKALGGTGPIHVLDPPKLRGGYRAECRVGAKAVVADRFEITGTPDVAPLDARRIGSALYEGADTPPDDEAVADVTFSAAKVRSLWLVAMWDHPTDQGGTTVGYACKILTGKNVTLSDTGPQRIAVAPGDRTIILRQRFVPAPRQRWVAGKYTLTCTSSGTSLFKTSFDLVR